MSVFDTSGNPLNVPSRAFPNLNAGDGLVFDPNTGYLYATNTGNKTVTIYDLSGNQITAAGAFSNLSASGDPEDITFDAFSRTFLVNDATGNQIYAYDENGNAITLPSGAFANISGPFGIVWNGANNTIYISNFGTNTITAYNPAGTQISLPGSFSGLSAPDDFIVDPVNGNMYVTEAETDESGNCTVSGVAEFDLNGDPLTASGGFTTVFCPDSIALLGTTGIGAPELLYVTNIFGNSVTVYDQDGNDLTSQVATGGFPGLSGPTGIIIVTTPPTATTNSLRGLARPGSSRNWLPH
jgi:DNA-binding beta-propeller fold protein YncE